MATINNFTGVFSFLNPEDPTYPGKYAGVLYPTVLHACYAALTNNLNLRTLIADDPEVENLPKYLDDTQLMEEELWDRITDILIDKFSKYEFGNKMLLYVNSDAGDKIEYPSNNILFGVVPNHPESKNMIGRILTLIARYGTSKENIMNSITMGKE